jgi:hypothetical protein
MYVEDFERSRKIFFFLFFQPNLDLFFEQNNT